MQARLWRTEGDRAVCDLCPNACRIAEGAVGRCGVRRVENGSLIALTYGLVSSIAVDPIEKKPVFHFHPGISVLSVGSVGCSMRCGHCQNWQISRATPDSGIGLHQIDPVSLVDMAQKYRCPGIAFTYNEPIIWIEYVADVAAICRQRGLLTVMVTNGYVTPEGLDFIGESTDVWRVDLKGAREETYRTLCHVADAASVTAAAERARHRWGMHVEVVTNIIPGINDTAGEAREMADWIVSGLGPDTPWHVTRFVPCLELADREATPIATLERFRRIGHEAGLHHVYLGNVAEPGGEDTVCPSCGAVAIVRSGYTINARATQDGHCARCGRDLALVE
ncbi:MAG: AmmeMemoRadiSam system radical SAM enzyme [Coriobacteriia bacterium]|nr:AmmeMemoRadiSam system radical SAM enzyme [Coriobacteriia bacterium]